MSKSFERLSDYMTHVSKTYRLTALYIGCGIIDMMLFTITQHCVKFRGGITMNQLYQTYKNSHGNNE